MKIYYLQLLCILLLGFNESLEAVKIFDLGIKERAHRQRANRAAEAAAVKEAEQKYENALKGELLKVDDRGNPPAYEDAMFDAFVHEGFKLKYRGNELVRLYIKDFDSIARYAPLISSNWIRSVFAHVTLSSRPCVMLKDVQNSTVEAINEQDIDRLRMNQYRPDGKAALEEFFNSQMIQLQIFKRFES